MATTFSRGAKGVTIGAFFCIGVVIDVTCAFFCAGLGVVWTCCGPVTEVRAVVCLCDVGTAYVNFDGVLYEVVEIVILDGAWAYGGAKVVFDSGI